MGKGPVSADEVALMSPEDVFLFRQQYSAYLGRLFSQGGPDCGQRCARRAAANCRSVGEIALSASDVICLPSCSMICA